MANNVVNLTGKEFGFLTVISKDLDERGDYWFCECRCGGCVTVSGNDLRSRRVISCGKCGLDEYDGEIFPGIGEAYMHMMSEYHGYCVDASDPNKPNFEFRDDFVCKDWLGDHGFVNFHRWAVSNGYKDGMFLCRHNRTGDYDPSNCYWSSSSDYKRYFTDECITYGGITMTIPQWAEQTNSNMFVLYNRYDNGWSDTDILGIPANYKETVVPNTTGEYHTLKDWGAMSGIDPLTLYKRIIEEHMYIDDALTTGATNPEIFNHIGPPEMRYASYSMNIEIGVPPIEDFDFEGYYDSFNVPGSDNVKQAIMYTDDFGNMMSQQEYEERFGNNNR